MRLIVTVGALAAVCARVCLLERARTSCNCCIFPLGVLMSMCGMGWDGMDTRNNRHTARCICPRLVPMYAWRTLQGPLRSWIACLHDGWRIGDPWNGEDPGVINHLFVVPWSPFVLSLVWLSM